MTSDGVHLVPVDVIISASDMSSWVKAPVGQAWHAEVSSGTHIMVGEKGDFTTLFYDLHTCTVAWEFPNTLIHMCTYHMHTHITCTHTLITCRYHATRTHISHAHA